MSKNAVELKAFRLQYRIYKYSKTFLQHRPNAIVRVHKTSWYKKRGRVIFRFKFSHPHLLKIGGRLRAKLPASRVTPQLPQVLTEETSVATTCKKCREEQYMVRPYCDKQDSNQRFSIKMDKRYKECCVCKSDMT